MLYEKELKALEQSSARYLIIGGIAAAFYGYPGGTFDLDFMPDLSSANLDKIIKALTNLGYIPRIPIDPEEVKDPKKREFWQTEKNMKAFTFINPNDLSEHIDLMICSTLNFEDAYQRRRVIRSKDITVPLVSLEDLVRLKKDANRPKDQDAIAFLEYKLMRQKND